MNCKKAKKLMSAYIDDMLSDSKKSVFEAHLEHCESCKNEFLALKEIILLTGNIKFTAPLTMVGAYAGISISDKLREFVAQGWKMVLIACLVMTGTFICSAFIANVVLSWTGVI